MEFEPSWWSQHQAQQDSWARLSLLEFQANGVQYSSGILVTRDAFRVILKILNCLSLLAD